MNDIDAALAEVRSWERDDSPEYDYSAAFVLADEVERLRALMTPPVDALQVVALGQARLLIASLTEKVQAIHPVER